MRIRLIAFILLVVFQLPTWAQHTSDVLAEGSPAIVSVSEKRLQLLDQFIQDYVNKGYIPGGVFLIARDNQIVYNKTFGFRSTDKKMSYKKDDIFRICSMTKAVTTVAIMQLYEEGKLGLDDAVQDYIPAFKKTQVLDTFNENGFELHHNTSEIAHYFTAIADSYFRNCLWRFLSRKDYGCL